MMKKNKRKGFIKKKFDDKSLTTILIIFALIFILTVVTYLIKYYGIAVPLQQKEKKSYCPKKTELSFNVLSNDVVTRSMKVPAVDKEGNGVITTIVVESMKGTGRTLVDINNLLFWADTQESIRKARDVAQNYTGLNLSNYDLVYHIYANASVVGGPSAGAAITILTIAALLNKTINGSVMITGAINYDGTIGPVGDIIAKAKIAKKSNATLFLVPLTQGKEIKYEERQICKKYGNVEYCTVEKIPKRIDIGKEVGMKVIEVENIKEAAEYFLI